MAAPKRRRALFVAIILGISLLGGASVGLLAGYLSGAPSLEDVQFDPELTTYIYDIEGRVITRLYKEHRIPVSIDRMPQHLKDAVLAIEDDDFYQHHGFDAFGIARAFLANLRAGRTVQGGSTITQQLAKLVFTGDDVTYARKLQELLWAIQIERKYTKDEILETYLNEVYFGPGANVSSIYGVQAAAQNFFGKDVAEINLAEAALLAAVLNGAGYYSPYIDMEAALRRRNLVLARMQELGMITSFEAQATMEEPIVLAEHDAPAFRTASYFVDYVRQQLIEEWGEERVFAGGLHVYTTLDLDMQRAAENAFLNGLPLLWGPDESENPTGLRQPQGALVALDPRTGEIRAMVGGTGEDTFNRAVQAQRQPGSAMKPYVYAAAIEEGVVTPGTVIIDEPVTYTLPNGEMYEPQNFDERFRGPVTVREALEDSLNIPAVKVAVETGPETVVRYVEAMGVTSLVKQGLRNDLGPAMALGGLTQGISPLQMAAAYGVFANRGIYTEPIAILRVVGRDDTELATYRPRKRPAISEETAFLITDMMRGVIQNGTGWRANIGRPVAGKTGTTQHNVDAWFIGFTPDLVAAVWIGVDRRHSMPWGSGAAVPIWRDFALNALADVPASSFPDPPPSIVGPILIDVENGLRVPDGCRLPAERTRYEIFTWGTEPNQYSPECVWSGPSTLPNLSPEQGAGDDPSDEATEPDSNDDGGGFTFPFPF